jgi:hypothetical protein
MAQRQIPGGPFVNETSTAQRMIPGWLYINEIVASVAWTFDEAVRPNAVTLTNLAGAYTDIDDDPTTPDANWLVKT